MFAFYVFIIAPYFHLSIHFLKNDKKYAYFWKNLLNCNQTLPKNTQKPLKTAKKGVASHYRKQRLFSIVIQFLKLFLKFFTIVIILL